MAEFRTEPEDIADWLESSFGDSEVDVSKIDDRLVYLFRIYDRDRSPFPTLIISWEALEDWDLTTIVADFERHQLVERLTRKPGTPLIYLRIREIEKYSF